MKYIVSNHYTFAVDILEDYGVHTYRFVAMSKHPYPCVQITVYDEIGNIDMLNYYANCSLSDKLLEKGTGSIYMLKTALTFVNNKHPSISRYDLQDETFMDLPNKPLITARRLLLGEMGWYEEHFDALPTKKTKQILNFLRNPKTQEVIRGKLPNVDVDKTWWSAKNTMAICYMIKCPGSVIGTSWYIPQKVIEGYNISYEENDYMNGGAAKNIKRIFTKAMQRKIPYDVILDAKYRNFVSFNM